VKIHVELRPVEVMRLRALDVKDRTHGCISEPGEVLEREEVLCLVEQQPEAVRRDAEDFTLEVLVPRGLDLILVLLDEIADLRKVLLLLTARSTAGSSQNFASPSADCA